MDIHIGVQTVGVESLLKITQFRQIKKYIILGYPQVCDVCAYYLQIINNKPYPHGCYGGTADICKLFTKQTAMLFYIINI